MTAQATAPFLLLRRSTGLIFRNNVSHLKVNTLTSPGNRVHIQLM
jgi:hypothetical protein